MSEHGLWYTENTNFIEQNFKNFKIYVYLNSLSESRLFVEKHCFIKTEKRYKKEGG